MKYNKQLVGILTAGIGVTFLLIAFFLHSSGNDSSFKLIKLNSNIDKIDDNPTKTNDSPIVTKDSSNGDSIPVSTANDDFTKIYSENDFTEDVPSSNKVASAPTSKVTTKAPAKTSTPTITSSATISPTLAPTLSPTPTNDVQYTNPYTKNY